MKNNMVTATLLLLLFCLSTCGGFELKNNKIFKGTRGVEIGLPEEVPPQEAPKEEKQIQVSPPPKCPKCKKCVCEVSQPVPELVLQPPTEITDKRFDLSIGVFGNSQYSKGDYALGATAGLTYGLGLGAKVAGEFHVNKKSSIYTQLQVQKTPLNGTFNGVKINQDSSSSIYGDLGYRYTFNRYLSAKAFMGLRQDYVFYIASGAGNLEQFWHGLLGMGADYSFFKAGKFSLDGGTDASIFLPTKKSRFQTKTGFLFGTEIRPTFDYTHPFFAFFRFEYFKLMNSIFVNQYGTSLLFGMGWKFRLEPVTSL